MTEKIEKYFTNTRIALIALVLNILFVIYAALIQNNDLKNLVKQHDEAIKKIDLQVQNLDIKKVDKETFQLMLSTLVDLKNDIRDMKTDLREHMNK